MLGARHCVCSVLTPLPATCCNFNHSCINRTWDDLWLQRSDQDDSEIWMATPSFFEDALNVTEWLRLPQVTVFCVPQLRCQCLAVASALNSSENPSQLTLAFWAVSQLLLPTKACSSGASHLSCWQLDHWSLNVHSPGTSLGSCTDGCLQALDPLS